MSNQRKIPITRVNKFFSAEDYRLDVEMGREGIAGDNNFVIVLYKVDRAATTTDDVYGEAGPDEIRYLPPVELIVMPTFEEAENKTYNSNGSLQYLETGNLSFFEIRSILSSSGRHFARLTMPINRRQKDTQAYRLRSTSACTCACAPRASDNTSLSRENCAPRKSRPNLPGFPVR